jgi:hypothetical protein
MVRASTVIHAVCLAPALAVVCVTASADGLSTQQIAEAAALGQTCRAPILLLRKPHADVDVYLETPFARAALAAATARMMRVPLDSRAVRNAMNAEGVRVWASRRDDVAARTTISAIQFESNGRLIAPVARRDVRLFVGLVASHGIIEPLRARFPEYTFDRMPAGIFDVVLDTNLGVQRYHVRPQVKAALLTVCNQPRRKDE